ncbi:MAG: hypothetical protein ACOX24_05160 [Christensenellales bacterium]|jgi:uncharacterized membrane protein|nr:hypothetical protein [Clostridiales bacterium]
MNKEIKIGKYTTTPKKLLFLLLNIAIIITFAVQIIYCAVAFFRVATGGIAGGNVNNIPFEEIVKRRLYAIELWISASGLAVYLAVIYKKKFRNPLTCEKASEKEDNTAE